MVINFKNKKLAHNFFLLVLHEQNVKCSYEIYIFKVPAVSKKVLVIAWSSEDNQKKTDS